MIKQPWKGEPGGCRNPLVAKDYRLFARSLGLAGAGLALLVVPVYQIAEFFQAGGIPPLWWQHAAWRAPVLAAAIVTLAWCLTHSDGYGAPVVVRLLAAAIMVMIFGLFTSNFLADSANVDHMIHGLILSTFAVSLLSLRGAGELLLLFGTPLVITLVVLYRLGEPVLAVIETLFDSIMMLTVGLIASELLYRTRTHNFLLQHELRQFATTDPLTGLNNRRHIMPQLHSEIARSHRHGTPFSVMMADLDYFKHVNDRHGHAAGDGVLRIVSDRIRAMIRIEDRAVRWGGEEFLVLLPDTDAAEANVVAEKIRHAIADEPLEIDGVDLSVTISLGVAEFAGESDPETLIRRADSALYEAKQTGRNRVCVAEPRTAAA